MLMTIEQRFANKQPRNVVVPSRVDMPCDLDWKFCFGQNLRLSDKKDQFEG
jgi:hypothetical protein